jgi:hypothetical protein
VARISPGRLKLLDDGISMNLVQLRSPPLRLTESLPLDSRYLLSPGHLVAAMDTELGRKICVIAFALALLPACDNSKPKGVVYTLHRNSPAFADMRIHVATFDAAEDKDYNRDNCQIARDLFASQPGVTIKYWCERGRFTQ